MNKFSKELIESLTEAVEHAEGKPGAVRVQVVEVPEPSTDNEQENAKLTSPHAQPRRMG